MEAFEALAAFAVVDADIAAFAVVDVLTAGRAGLMKPPPGAEEPPRV